MFDLAGRKAIVTGASSGLGAHFARVLASAGARVALAARRRDRLDALAADLKTIGADTLVVEMDVTSTSSVQAGVDQVADTWGAADILVNNSGVSREAFAHDMSEEDWDTVMDTNLKGVWRVQSAVSRAMIAANTPGSIINIASITASGPCQTLAAYAASKAAVDHFTRVTALELARYQIRVNAISPGYFQTEINEGFFDTDAGAVMLKRIPMRRLGNYEDLSGPLLLLASGAGAYMTGTTLVVDGGHLQRSL